MLISAHLLSWVLISGHLFSGTVFFSSGGARLPMAIVCLAPPGNDKAKKMVRQKQTSINFEKKEILFNEEPWSAIVIQCDRNEVQLLSQTLGARAGEDNGLLWSHSAEQSSYEDCSISSALAGESGGRRLPSAGQGWCKLTVLYRPWLITIIIIKRKPRCCQNEIAIIFLKPKVSLHCDELGSYEQLQCDNGNCWCVHEQTGGIIFVIKFVMDVITTTKINHSELLSQLYYYDVLQIQEKLFQLLSLKLSSSSYPASTIKTK